jgi:phytoene desaturase
VFLSDAADGGIALELLPAFWQLDPLRSMEDGLRRHLHSRHLRQLFGRFATYVGASPFHARGTLNAIAHRELSGDWWYPKGGVYTIARALERLAKELGVQIHTSSPVRQIVVEAATASGVMLADGSQIDVSAVISNVDVAMAYDKLLPAAAIPERPRQRMLTRMPSASSFIMLLGVEGQHPHLAHHNVFFSHDDKREFHDIFGRGLPTDDPSIYVAITAKHDAQDAPAGCENWFVMVNTPPLSNKFDWAVNAPAYRALVLERLASFGVDIRDHIRSERLITPLDHERLAGARRGALYGLPADNVIATLQRPQNRDPHVQRLYHVGGSTHLAGGVPMIVQSGAVVARLLAQDLL